MSIETHDQLPDQRFVALEHSGDVDCFVCGHKVNVLHATRIECNVGPMAFAHGSCAQDLGGEGMTALYHKTVLGAVSNLHPDLSR